MEISMKRASFLDTVKTVLFAFIGIRKREAHDNALVRWLRARPAKAALKPRPNKPPTRGTGLSAA